MDSSKLGYCRLGYTRLGVFRPRWEFISTLKSEGGIGVAVTHRRRTVGEDKDRNSTTGWYPHTFTGRAITGVWQNRGGTPVAFAAGTYVEYDATFITLDGVAEMDQIKTEGMDAKPVYWEVRGVQDVYDDTGGFAYRICQLKKLPLFFFFRGVTGSTWTEDAEEGVVYENYTTYTEVEENNDYIDVDPLVITWTDLKMNEDSYVYRNMGDQKISGDFEHWVDTTQTAMDTAYYNMVWSLWNTVGSWRSCQNTQDDDGVGVYVKESSGNLVITLSEWVHPTQYTDSSTSLTIGTRYYLKITRVGAVLNCDIYSDSLRRTLVDHLELTLHSTLNYQYLYAMQEYGDVSYTQTGSGRVQNLYLAS